MAALTRTVAEWLRIDMASASVPRYADAQFSSGRRGGIYIHSGSGKYAQATDSISTSESIRLSGNLTVTAKDWLNVGMSAASVSRYADAQSGEGWRNVGIFVHDSPTAKSRFAWEYLSTAESTSTGPPIRLSARESLMVFMSAASVSRYAVAQSGAGRRGGIYIHGPAPVFGESLRVTEVVRRSLVLSRSCSESLSTADAAVVFRPPKFSTATDAPHISESVTAIRTIARTATESLSAGGRIVGDSWPIENRNDEGPLQGPIPGGPFGEGQSFTPSGSGPLVRAGASFRRQGSPTGNVRAILYAHDGGTYGSGGKPTGPPLATSDPIAMSSVGTAAHAVYYFNFPTPYFVTGGTHYVIMFDCDTAGIDGSNFLWWGMSNPGTHAGNAIWHYQSPPASEEYYFPGSQDDIFYVETAGEYAVATVTNARSTTESLTISEVVTRTVTHSFTVFAQDHLVISEVASSIRPPLFRTTTDHLTTSETVVRTVRSPLFRTTSDALSTSENAVRQLGLVRFAAENLSTFDQAALLGVKARSVSDSLHVSEALFRALDLPRATNEALTIAVVGRFSGSLSRTTSDFLLIQEFLEREGGDRLRHVAEFLHISELATSVRLAGPFVYLLPFPTGNLPVVSTLGGPVAAGEFRCVDELDRDVVTTSALAGPVSESDFMAWVSTSQLALQVAESNLLVQVAESQLAVQQAISSLIMQRADSNLEYVQ